MPRISFLQETPSKKKPSLTYLKFLLGGVFPANTTVCKYKRIRTRTPRYGPEDIAVAQSLAIISKARVQVQGTGTRRDKSSRCLYLGTSVETHKNDYEKWCRRARRG